MSLSQQSKTRKYLILVYKILIDCNYVRSTASQNLWHFSKMIQMTKKCVVEITNLSKLPKIYQNLLIYVFWCNFEHMKLQDCTSCGYKCLYIESTPRILLHFTNHKLFQRLDFFIMAPKSPIIGSRVFSAKTSFLTIMIIKKRIKQ